MKYPVSILLMVIGLALFGVAYSQYSSIETREQTWNTNQAKFDEGNWQLSQAMGTESQWKAGAKKEFDKSIPTMLLGLGGIACLLGLLALALPAKGQKGAKA